MADYFVLALLGHLVGDYLAQTKYMALHKSDPGWKGLGICALHSAIYATAVCFLLWTVNPFAWLAVAIPHGVIDRYSLANKYLKLIHGRTFESAFASTDKYREFDVAFTSIVYTVTDNTMHLFCLLPVIKFFA